MSTITIREADFARVRTRRPDVALRLGRDEPLLLAALFPIIGSHQTGLYGSRRVAGACVCMLGPAMARDKTRSPKGRSIKRILTI